MDREIELVAGAFSSSAEKSRIAGEDYRIDPARAYPDIATMIAQEAAREDGIDFVAITTPNHMHLPAAKAALEAGLAVICDKPATTTLSEAHELAAIVEASGKPFALTYTYSGYPLVREARASRRALWARSARWWWNIRRAGWPSRTPASRRSGAAIPHDRHWRMRGGHRRPCVPSGRIRHRLAVTQILADLGTVVPGRLVDDDCQILLRFDNGRAALLASQISVGERNGLTIRVYGEKAGLRWRQDDPNHLWLFHDNGRSELIQAGDPDLGEDARRATRTPGRPPGGLSGSLRQSLPRFRAFAARAGRRSGPRHGGWAARHGADRNRRPGQREGRRLGRFHNLRRHSMKTIKGPGIFLAQFLGDTAPFNTLVALADWARVWVTRAADPG
jgi:predicted dehydrogenase